MVTVENKAETSALEPHGSPASCDATHRPQGGLWDVGEQRGQHRPQGQPYRDREDRIDMPLTSGSAHHTSTRRTTVEGKDEQQRKRRDRALSGRAQLDLQRFCRLRRRAPVLRRSHATATSTSTTEDTQYPSRTTPPKNFWQLAHASLCLIHFLSLASLYTADAGRSFRRLHYWALKRMTAP